MIRNNEATGFFHLVFQLDSGLRNNRVYDAARRHRELNCRGDSFLYKNKGQVLAIEAEKQFTMKRDWDEDLGFGT